MADDIVAELDRWLAEWHRYFADIPSVDWAVIARARNEIMTLRGENAEMRRTFGSHFKEIRDEALEEAARACEGGYTTGSMRSTLKAIATAIRALKEKGPA